MVLKEKTWSNLESVNIDGYIWENREIKAWVFLFELILGSRLFNVTIVIECFASQRVPMLKEVKSSNRISHGAIKLVIFLFFCEYICNIAFPFDMHD